MPEDGQIILIDKPTGMTSFGVIARLKRVLSQEAGKKVKVGHTGTLDPFATGLMIVVTGKQTKNSGNYSKLDKWYEAEIVLGQISSTGDPEGEIVDKPISAEPSPKEIQMAIENFKGKIQQTPPVYSAIKINGRRAYDLARNGETIEMPVREVEIFDLEVVYYEYPILRIKTHVSSGTYIRSLAIDLGEKLQTGAYCKELRRTRVGEYDIADAKKLTDFGITS